MPTLSQIRAWDVDHLIEAADHWTATADRWDDVYGQVWQQSLSMDWQGQARDALVKRTTADRATVTPKSDQLREAALTARKGAGDISAVRRSVLYKVDDAHQAGFVVGEDLSVSDTRTSRNAAELAQRQAQAQTFSADIRSRAAQLIAADSEVGTKLTATAGDVGSLTFDEKPITYNGKPIHVGADPRNGTIRLVDWKQAPTPTPSPGHTGQDVREAIRNLPKGTAPFIDEIRSEQDLRSLWNWATEGATQRTGSSYPGTERLLPDGTIIGMRESGEHGPTMDIRTPDNSYTKVHVNTDRGGVADIPVRAAGPPEGAASEPRAPEEAEPGPRAPVESPPVERAPVEPPAPRPAPAVPEPFVPMGPVDPNAFPHFVQPPHSHHGPPILGKDDLADLPEYEP
ncbi:MAG: hypothetical protein JO045_17065 [Mycobacterium sp.]|nr:hypothetical protein [Mycobacterium sp.]